MNSSTRKHLSFENSSGNLLSASLEKPGAEIKGYVLFAHCFTCGKNIGTATQLSRGLAARGYAVLRFDFTGLGDSEGDFSQTNLSSNIDDLITAAKYMSDNLQAPDILLGHSMGGTASIFAASQIPSIKILATIATPGEPAHIAHLLKDSLPTILEQGYGTVNIGGQKFTLRKQFFDDINKYSFVEAFEKLKLPFVVLQSPNDELVEFSHAGKLLKMAKEPKKLITLDGADHLLSKTVFAELAAESISTWANEHLN